MLLMNLINVNQISRFLYTPVEGNLLAKVLRLMIRVLSKVKPLLIAQF